MKALEVEQLHITPGTLTVRVHVQEGAHRTNARIASYVAADFPDLPQHSCVNSKGPAFASVMTDTPLPHLLEHLIISLQVAEEPPDSRVTFIGHTTWTNEAHGIATVTVNFRSDACALRALAYACTYLNDILKKESHHD